MQTYAGESQYLDEINIFEETDLVLAETDNIPLQQLADRTRWLKDQIGRANRLEGEAVITANENITLDLSGKLITAVSNAVVNLSLADVASFKPGTIIPVNAFCAANSVVNLLTTAGQKIFDNGPGVSSLSMHNRESLFLVALPGHWKLLDPIGNFFTAGEEVKARKQLNNTLILNGALLSRERYPRLWEFAKSLEGSLGIVTEETWNSDPLTYRGCFSFGDGASTFRIPDERGMFERMLDLGRGVDISRAYDYAGGYEADRVGPVTVKAQRRKTKRGGGSDPVESVAIPGINGFLDPFNDTMSYTDNPETTVKNIGKLNLIKY